MNRFLWTPCIQLSNKRGVHAYRFWKIPPSTKRNPPSTFIDFITKVSDIIAEPNEDFSHGHFELQNFILAQKMMFITPSTFSDFATPLRSFERLDTPPCYRIVKLGHLGHLKLQK